MMKADLHDSSSTDLLLKLSVEGNQDAFSRLFRRHERNLRGLIDRRIDAGLTRRFDTSDVIQETRITAFRHLKDYSRRRPMPLAIWLQRTALQQLSDLRRHHLAAKRSLHRERAGTDRSSMLLSQSLLGSQSTPSGIYSRQEEVRRVQTALTELGNADREVLLMRYVEQFSNREIAYLLDITEPAASQRHGLALLRLRRVLKRLYPDA